jgi:hypothetical protein
VFAFNIYVNLDWREEGLRFRQLHQQRTLKNGQENRT